MAPFAIIVWIVFVVLFLAGWIAAFVCGILYFQACKEIDRQFKCIQSFGQIGKQ